MVWWAAVLVLVAAPCAAQMGGQQAFAQAEQSFARGEALLAQRAYPNAEAEFRQAYQLMQGHPNQSLILLNVGRSVESQPGREREALQLYERMIVESSAIAATDAARSERAIAQSRIDALHARGISSGGGLSLSPIGLIIGGSGAAVAIAGVIVGIVALAQRSSVLAMCTDTRCPPEAQASASQIDTFAAVADVLIFGGLAIAATGAILTFVLPADSGARAAASCGPTGCYASLEGRFQ
jgi:hypothetical protein